MDKFNDTQDLFNSNTNLTDSQIAGLIQQLQSKISEEEDMKFEDEKSPSESNGELSDTNTLSSSNIEEVGNNPKTVFDISNVLEKDYINKKRPRKKPKDKKKKKHAKNKGSNGEKTGSKMSSIKKLP